MVYLTQDSATGLFPKVTGKTISQLIITNLVTKIDTSFFVEDLTTDNKSYYTLEVDMSDFADGQYDYKICDASNDVQACGILQVGDFDRDVNTYETEKLIIVYNG